MTLFFESLLIIQKKVLKVKIVIEIRSIRSENQAYIEFDQRLALIL